MTSISCTRIIRWCMGHRVWGHEGKCNHLHGHNYEARISLRAKELDEVGRVIDFGIVKHLVKPWIDANWDHKMVLHAGDPLVKLFNNINNCEGPFECGCEVCGIENPGEHPFYEMPYNPTAENIARFLLDRVVPSSLESNGHNDVVCTSVEVWETPNCYAIARLS